jgi:hypothetical protein
MPPVSFCRYGFVGNSFGSLFDKFGAAVHKLVVGVYEDANIRDITFFVEMVAVCTNLELQFICSREEFVVALALAMFEDVDGKPVVSDGKQYHGYYSALLVREGDVVKIFKETTNSQSLE